MSPVETTTCECREHGARGCVTIPIQHVRYDIRVGPEEQGIVRLCASCFCDGHMVRDEHRWRGQVSRQQKARATDAG